MVHQENYTRGHVALYCYDDGFTVGPLPKKQAWDEMNAHMERMHGGGGGWKKIRHSSVEKAMKGKPVPKVNKQGGFKGRDDLFPKSTRVYPNVPRADYYLKF